MSTQNSLVTRNAARLGYTNVRIQAMHGHGGAFVALTFSTDKVTGLEVTFHGTPDEMRAFAAELVRHADAVEPVVEELA